MNIENENNLDLCHVIVTWHNVIWCYVITKAHNGKQFQEQLEGIGIGSFGGM